MSDLCLADAIIESIVETDTLSDQSIAKLNSIFPETLVVAALDLVDRENIIKYVVSWRQSEYEVLGSTTTYNVLLDLTTAPVPYFCSCPAFAYAVLLCRTHLMCKHVLATRLAVKLSRCIERYVTADSLIELFNKQLSIGG